MKMNSGHALKYICVICMAFIFTCCNTNVPDKLPFLGQSYIIKSTGDTIYPSIRPFSFTDQNNKTVTNATFDHKIYVADFIFLSCPSICPKMNESMLRVYKSFELNPDILFLSHTIDPERDSIKQLKEYSNSLKVSAEKWHFVTGLKDSIYSMSEKSYYSTAYKDSTAPGGFAHSGGLLLIDRNKHIRGVYDGTEPQEATRLINDIQVLLKE